MTQVAKAQMNSVSMILQTSVCKFRKCLLFYSIATLHGQFTISKFSMFFIYGSNKVAPKLFFMLMRRIVISSQFMKRLSDKRLTAYDFYHVLDLDDVFVY